MELRPFEKRVLRKREPTFAFPSQVCGDGTSPCCLWRFTSCVIQFRRPSIHPQALSSKLFILIQGAQPADLRRRRQRQGQFGSLRFWCEGCEVLRILQVSMSARSFKARQGIIGEFQNQDPVMLPPSSRIPVLTTVCRDPLTAGSRRSGVTAICRSLPRWR